MISLKHHFLFIHVPKTGGNSIQNILADYDAMHQACASDPRPRRSRQPVSGKRLNG